MTIPCLLALAAAAAVFSGRDNQLRVPAPRVEAAVTIDGVRKIPRVKAEYQVSRPIFVSFIGEYDARRQDRLRDDTRTELPILIRDPATGLYATSMAFENNRFSRRCVVLVSADAGHGGVRRLQQHPVGTGGAAIR